MKKLNLKLESKEMLSKAQMKKIVGGEYGPCYAVAFCSNTQGYLECESYDNTGGECYGENDYGVVCYDNGIVDIITCDGQ